MANPTVAPAATPVAVNVIVKFPKDVTLPLGWEIVALPYRVVDDNLNVSVEVMAPKDPKSAIAKVGNGTATKLLVDGVTGKQWSALKAVFAKATDPALVTPKTVADVCVLTVNKMASENTPSFEAPEKGAGVIAMVFESGRPGCRATAYVAYPSAEAAQEATDIWYDETADARREALAALLAERDKEAATPIKSAKVTK